GAVRGHGQDEIRRADQGVGSRIVDAVGVGTLELGIDPRRHTHGNVELHVDTGRGHGARIGIAREGSAANRIDVAELVGSRALSGAGAAVRRAWRSKRARVAELLHFRVGTGRPGRPTRSLAEARSALAPGRHHSRGEPEGWDAKGRDGEAAWRNGQALL